MQNSPHLQSESFDISINGLSFEELILILQKQGIADNLTKHRNMLGSVFSYSDIGLHESQMNELCVLGLCSRLFKGNTYIYELTDTGRTVLNRLSFQ